MKHYRLKPTRPSKHQLISMDTEILTYFKTEPMIETLTREELIKALLKKHTEQLAPLKAERKELKKKVDDLEAQREAARKARDAANTAVAQSKEARQNYHQEANEKRRTFFVLMEKIDDLEKLDDEVEGYRNKLEKMEWELQTRAVTSSDEKTMIKKIQVIYARLTEANKEAQVRLGLQEEVPSVARDVSQILARAQEHHEELLAQALESEKHHTIYRDIGKELSSLRLRFRRLERQIGNHKESVKYWGEWVGKGGSGE